MTASGWARIVPVICAILVAGCAWAQDFPAKPVRLITSAAGGGSDFTARLIAQGLTASLNQQFIVDNRGGGVVPIEIVAKSPPDGYSLLYYGSTLWLLPLLQDNLSYDVLRDFVPVSMTVNSPIIVAVNPSLPVKSIKELIALAKARPGELNYGSASAGSPAHLATELFKSLAKVDMVRVPYKAAGPSLTALITGEIQVLMSASGGMSAHISSGRVRALAVSTVKRSASFPNLPTVAEAGLPGYEYSQLFGIFAPAKTPAAIVDRVSAETARVVNRADMKDKLFSTGTDAEGSTPQEAVAKIKSEMARLGKVIKDAKIRGD
jgi:tripartite-type tricarboxylate transporter receptor subunit TctC